MRQVSVAIMVDGDSLPLADVAVVFQHLQGFPLQDVSSLGLYRPLVLLLFLSFFSVSRFCRDHECQIFLASLLPLRKCYLTVLICPSVGHADRHSV